MNAKQRNHSQRAKDKPSRLVRPAQRNVRIKRASLRKPSHDATRTLDPPQIESTVPVLPAKFETIEPTQAAQPSPTGSSTAGESATPASSGSNLQSSVIPAAAKPADNNDSAGRQAGFLGHIQEMYGWTGSAEKKREQQRAYKEQLQAQIVEKLRRRSSSQRPAAVEAHLKPPVPASPPKQPMDTYF